MRLVIEKPLASLRGVESSHNIADRFEPEDLARIGAWCHRGYEQDELSRADWLKKNDAAMRLAMQIKPGKTFPWPNASNVAFPLLTIAALQFHSRAYPALFTSPELVKYRVPGTDATGEMHDRGRLLARFMSYQANDLDEAFEEQHDRLLINVPLVGCAFIKAYYDHAVGTPVSEFVPAKDLVVDYYAKSIDAALRKTQRVTLYRNEIYERCVAGKFLDILEEPWYITARMAEQRATDESDNRVSGQKPTPETTLDALLFLEQHTWLDLDADGYAEPYIVVFEATSKRVVRIVARWERAADVYRVGSAQRVLRIQATEYYTKYGLVPAPDGSIYDMGFGALIGPLNEATDTLINQLIDAGTAATTSGGFLGRGVKIRGGAMRLEPWAWKTVDTTGDDLRKGVFPAPIREPSAVLFNLLNLLINYTQRIGGATDTMVGENPGQNTPATNMKIMVEQGTKIYSAIFKRLWRSMRGEFHKRFDLNARFLADNTEFGDTALSKDDFLVPASRFTPTADPNLSNEAIRLQQAVALREAAATNPAYDRDKVELNFLRALGIDSPEEYYGSVKDIQPPEDPKLVIAKMKQEVDMARLELEEVTLMETIAETRRLNTAKILELEAKVAQILDAVEGNAEASEVEGFRALIDARKHADEMMMRQQEMMMQRQALAQQAEQGAVRGDQ